MISRTITTYTFLNYLKEKGIKQLDLYVPLVCKSIVKHDAKEVDRDLLCRWFNEDYGIKNIYQGVYESILKRMKGTYVTFQNGTYQPNMHEIMKLYDKYPDQDVSTEFNAFTNDFVSYAKNNYQTAFTQEDAELGVLELLHSRDGDLLLQPEKYFDVINKQSEKQKGKLKYALSQFVIWCKENSPKSLAFLIKLAKGHALTSIITMKGVESYVGKMQGVKVALDTPIIFNLLGLNYQTNLDLEKELLEVLKKQGAEFIVFQEHYQEVKRSIGSTIGLLRTKNYSLDKASRLLRYALKNHISSYLLNLKLQQLDSVLEKYEIQIVGAPDSKVGYSEIDETRLQDLMENIYTDNHTKKLDEQKKTIIDNDVKVVSYIYRLRGQEIATNFKNCNALLVTTNTALAFTSKDSKISQYTHRIPVCLTDVVLSTSVWLNYPNANNDINEKILISECYRNTTISDDLLQRFYKEIDSINQQNPISEEQMLLANTSEYVMELLESKTYNDINLYTDMTTSEILDEIDKNKNQRIFTQEEQLLNVTTNSHKRAFKIALIVYWVIVCILAGLFLFLKYVDFSNWHGLKILFNLLLIIPTLWGLLSWSKCIPQKASVIQWIADLVYGILYKDLDKQ